MSLITRMLKQTAVYWPLAAMESAGGDSFDNYGQPLVTDPLEISVRWEDRAEEFLDAKGARVLSNAVVFVSQDVDIGGVLMLGELTDITDADVPKENENAWEIKRFDKIPNLRNTEFLRTAYL